MSGNVSRWVIDCHAKGAAPIGPLASRRVFVVHGHDDAAKETVARFLEKIGLECRAKPVAGIRR